MHFRYIVTQFNFERRTFIKYFIHNNSAEISSNFVLENGKIETLRLVLKTVYMKTYRYMYMSS